jgi:uncharacterized protein (TIGR02598 family)
MNTPVTSFRRSSALARPLAGFTLVEVALSVAIAAVAMMGLLSMAMIAMQWGRTAVDETIVGTIAEDVFTDLKANNINYSSVVTTTKDYDRDGNPVPPSTLNPFYRCLITVSNVPPAGFAAQVKLQFLWPNVNSFANAPNTNTFVSLIANYTPYP